MPSNPALTFAPGAVVGNRYRVDELVGQGGFGAVFRATQLASDHTVALKILLPDLLDQEGLLRFAREAEIVQRLDHPNVVRLLDFGRAADGSPFLVFEYLRGQTLEDAARAGGPMPVARAARIAAQILKALMQAHERGVVHRDLKPANVFLCDFQGERDFVKVLDFGIAKADDSRTLTARGATVGTPAYMAPEQLMGRDATAASDLYSLGLMIAEVLAGQPIFAGLSLGEIVRAQTSPDPVPLPPAALGSPLGSWLDRATQKIPERRFASAADMLAYLDAILTGTAPAADIAYATTRGVTAVATPLVPTPPPRATARRKRSWMIAPAAAIAGGAVITAVVLAGRSDAPSAGTPKGGRGIWKTLIDDGVAEATINGDKIPDFVGVHADPDERLCAFDGATLRPIWCHPVRTPSPEPHHSMVALAGRHVVHVDAAGLAHLHDLGSGTEIAAFQLGARAEVICEHPDAPAKLWIKTVDRKGFALDTAAKKLTSGAARPESCDQGRREIDCPADSPVCPAHRALTLFAINGIRVSDSAVWNQDGVGIGERAPALGVPLLFGWRTDDPSPTQTRWRRPLLPGDGTLGSKLAGAGRIAVGFGHAVAAYEDASHVKHLLCVDTKDGKTRWDVPTGDFDRLALLPTRLYVQRRTRLEVRDVTDGKLVGGVGAP